MAGVRYQVDEKGSNAASTIERSAGSDGAFIVDRAVREYCLRPADGDFADRSTSASWMSGLGSTFASVSYESNDPSLDTDTCGRSSKCETDEEWPENPHQSAVEAQVRAGELHQGFRSALAHATCQSMRSAAAKMTERSAQPSTRIRGRQDASVAQSEIVSSQKHPGVGTGNHSSAGGEKEGNHSSAGGEKEGERASITGVPKSWFNLRSSRSKRLQSCASQNTGDQAEDVGEFIPRSNGNIDVGGSPQDLSICSYADGSGVDYRDKSFASFSSFASGGSGHTSIAPTQNEQRLAHESGARRLDEGYERDSFSGDSFTIATDMRRGGLQQFKRRTPTKAVLRAISCNDFQSASQLLQSAGCLNRQYLHSLVTDCIKASEIDGAMWCMDEMARLGVEPHIISFNTVLNGCAKSGNHELALKWWNRLATLNVTANNVTYNTMINAFTQARRPQDAEATLRQMIAAGLSPCKISFTAVIVALAKFGDAARAEYWLMEMRNMGVQADVVVYNAVLNACAKAGVLHRAQRWVAQMVQDGVAPDIRTYNSLIHACAKLGNNRAAASLFSEMKAVGLQPDTVTFGSLIDVSAKVGNVLEAEGWMNTMQAEGISPNAVCFNSMLHACAMSGDYPRGKLYFHRMQERGCEPSAITFNSMIAVFAQAGDEPGLKAMFEDMVSRDLRPDSVTLRTLQAARRNTKGAQNDAHIKRQFCSIVRNYLLCESARGVGRFSKSPCNGQRRPMQSSSKRFIADLLKPLKKSSQPDDWVLAQELQGLFD